MLICPSCSAENPEGQRFCGDCGIKLEAPSVHEARKIITALFCDLVGSTALGEAHDPEVLRPVLARYFDEMRTTIERHGGRVEKFIGDAIAAVFGLPIAHEDDALRAARAAIEMQERLVVLNEASPIPLVARIGVTTGEVLVPADDKPIVGDALNTASRLETAAAPGEVLIGEPTYRLIRDAVMAEQMEPLELKGKAEVVPVFRLVGVASLSPIRTRRLDAPMVGRSRETVLLAQAFERAVSDRSCQLFTVLGTAGAGKSRLVEEFLGTLDVEVLQGRCLPYGDGITFYPVTEAIKGALGLADFDDESTVQERIHASVEAEEHADAITANLAKLLGAGEGGSPEETFWAIRRFFETRGGERPLVIVFDDIHWGEETFLDLLEHVADWSRDAQILLLCMARPDLLDERPAWAGGKTNATTISLAPLTEDETTELIDHLLGEARLPTEVRDRITSVAEGNPLFVEEMLRMLIDDGLLSRDGGGWVPQGDLSEVAIPPTISALLSARLDRLSDPERQVIESAAVEGREFHRGAVVALLPETEKAAADQHLKSLTRKELISPERSSLPGEDAYRFRHLLIRDAAYDAIPKVTRGVLHERFADWLDEAAGTLQEQDEIIGYHLEQSYGYRTELGPVGEGERRLAEKAGRRLAAAGERAFARSDYSASVNLLSRASSLLPPDDPLRLSIMPDLGAAIGEAGDLDGARAVLGEAIERSEVAGDDQRRMHAVIQRWLVIGEGSNARHDAEEALVIFEAAGDERGLSRAWRFLGGLDIDDGQMGNAERALERALVHARSADDNGEQAAIYWTLGVILARGPTPVGEAIRRCEEVLTETEGNRTIAGYMLHAIAHLKARQGEFEEALHMASRCRDIQRENGAMWTYWVFAEILWDIKMLADEPGEALEILTEGYEQLELIGDSFPLISAFLAQSLYAVGRFDDAERRAQVAVDANDDDLARCAGMGVLASVLARRGRFEEAEGMAREAVAYFEGTEYSIDRTDVLMALAEVLRLAGRPDEAVSTIHEAIDLYDRREDIVSADKARKIIDSLST
jgi:class 3 adenylate cyclase/tetratricopeptide (TPR) repeat protein